MTRPSFAFTKWYLDCLDRDGRLLILYWTSLEWRRLRLAWHSVTRCEPDGAVRMRSSVVACDPPAVSDTTIRWKSARLNCEAELVAGVTGIAPMTLASGVSWACVAPAARATVRLGDETFCGTGYAERIELRVPPWKLGIRQLRWGRWISHDAARSLVWIEWNGAADTRWVFLDGKAAEAGTMNEHSVVADGATLALDDGHVVLDRGLGSTISRIPALRAVAPRWLLRGREVRRTRSGTLVSGRAESHGTAVDEVVDFG